MDERGGGEVNKELKLEEKEDRISALPDSIIQRILSFLNSTKEAIHCGILSKRWRDQWTRLPVLILDATGMYDETFFKFTDNALIIYDCFNIKKFYIKYLHSFKKDPQFAAKIRFATRRNVEELILICYCCFGKYMLPEFLFNNGSLVKLQTNNCNFMPNGRVNWEHLKELNLRFCTLPNQAIESVLSGSPLLESLELHFCDGFDKPAIASKSLKRLFVVALADFVPEISCPNLVELSVKGGALEYVSLSSQVIQNVLSSSPFLKLLKLCKCDGFDQLVIATESLRRLLLTEVKVSVIEILCPNLEELELEIVDNVALMNMPSSISAASNLNIDWRKGSVHWRRCFSNVHPSRS